MNQDTRPSYDALLVRLKAAESALAAVRKGEIDAIADDPAFALHKIEAENALEKARENMRLSEEKFARVFAAIPDAVVLSRVSDGQIRAVNDAFVRISGYSKEMAVGRTSGEIGLWVKPEARDEYIAELFRDRWVHNFEADYRSRDGNVLHMLISGTIIDTSDGRLFLSIVRDVTAYRRQADQIALLGRMLDDAPASITVHDTDGRFLFANRRTFAMHGYERDEFMAVNLRDLDTPDTAALLSERFKKIDQEGEAIFEVEHRRKDGTTFPLQVLARSIEWEGRPAVLSIAADITSQKRAAAALQRERENLRAIMAASPVGMMVFDDKEEIVYANPAAEHMFHHAMGAVFKRCGDFIKCVNRQADAKGCGHSDQCPECDLFNAIQQVLAGGDGVSDRETSVKIENAEGPKQAWFGFSVEPVRLDGKRHAILALSDITDRKLLKAQLVQAQKMESVGRLAGGVAHDFNNMLSVILGYTELALDKIPENDPLREDLDEVMQAAQRSTDIARQLLVFARRQTISPKVMDLNETVEEMLKMLRRLIGEDVDLSWQPGRGLWPVKMDPSQIDQVMANLCVNARDAISGVGKIIIETENVTLDEAECAHRDELLPGDYVLLIVSDTGRGMDAETRERIFEPFFTTKGVGEGTGLGLSTIYGIVKQNHGDIRVYSEPGKGTTFRIYLPRHSGEAYVVQDRDVPQTLMGRGETVLVAEDEDAILKLTARMLDRLGYTVLMAAGPVSAEQVAKTHTGPIHLLMTDVVMPEMSGRDLADRLIYLYPDLRVLYMSGYTANVIAHRGGLEEKMQFIAKPFSQRDLARKVREALE